MLRNNTHILIVEDNPLDVRLIQEHLSDVHQNTDLKIQYVATLDSAIECIKLNNYDVILLDIFLPDCNNLDGLARLRSLKQHIPIVVLTGLDDELLAIKAIEMGAQDYLLKEKITGPALLRVIRYAVERQRQRGLNNYKQSKLIVDDGGRLVFIDPESIVYISVEEKKVNIYTTIFQCSTSKITLQELEEKLKAYPFFFRTHRSYLVNINYLYELVPWFNGAYNLILKDKQSTQLPVSRGTINKLMNFVHNVL